jgi:hypothetical protein
MALCGQGEEHGLRIEAHQMHPQVDSSKPSRMYWMHTTNQGEKHGLRFEAHQMHPQVGSFKQSHIYWMHNTNPRTTLVAHHNLYSPHK